MALSAKSLFTYGLQVTTLNNKLDFQIVSMGTTLTATINLGFYSPAGLAQEIAMQMQSADNTNIYTATVNRTVMGGTQNRITISSNGAYLSLLFGTGTNVATSISTLIGFNASDYTGATTYTGSSTTGIALLPTFIGYNYLDDFNQSKLFGAVNVSASGLKEAVTFNIQQFINVEFRYEPKSNLLLWKNFFTWAIQQRQFDFTPEISAPNTVYNVTLEKTQYHDQGLGFQMKEMLPTFPNLYQTGPLVFRIILNAAQLI
jgi:hypothetical protein